MSENPQGRSAAIALVAARISCINGNCHVYRLRRRSAVVNSTDLSKGAFVAVDWGTSSFRGWLMAADGTVLAESRGTEGMLHCAGSGFAPVLRDHLAKLGADDQLPVLICGMAGARQGWVEAPYLETPTGVAAADG